MLRVLLLILAVLPASSRAQDRQQATALHDNRVQAHGPVGEAGRTPLLRLAMERHADGDAGNALAGYNEVLRGEPDNLLALLNRGIVLSTHQSQPARAIADLDRVLVLASGNVDALAFRGDAHMRLANYRQALADFDRAAALAPGHAQMRVLRGLARVMLGDVAGGHSDYAAALALDGRNVDALVNRAAIMAGGGDLDAGLRDLDAALTVAPRNARALYNRGYVHFARHEHDAAIADYSAAIELDPQFGWAYLNRCLARAVAGRDGAGALADCHRAQALLPDAPQVRALGAEVARRVVVAN